MSAISLAPVRRSKKLRIPLLTHVLDGNFVKELFDFNFFFYQILNYDNADMRTFIQSEYRVIKNAMRAMFSTILSHSTHFCTGICTEKI